VRNNTFCPAITAGTVSYAQVSYSITVLTVVTHRRTAVLRKPTHYLALQVTAQLPAFACCQSFFKIWGCGLGRGQFISRDLYN